MALRHVLLALLTAAIWGVNFTVIKVGLDSFPPLLLAALRFILAAAPALILPRPRIPWPQFLLIGATLFLGQFAFLFSGMKLGAPPGLASVLLQSQAFLTILIAALLLKERPTPRRLLGAGLALAGLLAIAATIDGAEFTGIGLGLCLAAALCWAVGNILLRRAGQVDMLAAVVWLSLIPPLPLLALSLWLDGPEAVGAALIHMSWGGLGAVLYIALLSTLLGFAIWGELLKAYPAGVVAPFSLLVPIFGAGSAHLLLGESFGSARIFGMILILGGLAAIALPERRRQGATT